MPSTILKPKKPRAEKAKESPLRLKTRAEAREYLSKHLMPVDHGPKGQPIYSLEEIQALNVIFPEDL